jgi:DNA methylase
MNHYELLAANDITQTALREDNKLRLEDRAVHDWYRFVLSFPPHLVRDYLQRFGVDARQRVLDPFCGTGTTLVECKKLGIPSIGIEPNPMACFASQVKVDWTIDPDGLLSHAQEVAEKTYVKLADEGIEDEGRTPLFDIPQDTAVQLRTLSAETWQLLLKDSISPLPLHKTLVLLGTLHEYRDKQFNRYERLALAKALVFGISNLHFGPEVGVRPAKVNAPVVATWLHGIQIMANDLHKLQGNTHTGAMAYLADARYPLNIAEPGSVDAVITSPPYPNEKDYTRTTRLESILLGFIRTKQDLRSLKQHLVRSNTQGVYKSDRGDLLVIDHDEIQRLADAIEARRIELG